MCVHVCVFMSSAKARYIAHCVESDQILLPSGPMDGGNPVVLRDFGL